MPKRPQLCKEITFVHDTSDEHGIKMASLLMDHVFMWFDFHGHLNDFEISYKNNGHNKKASLMVPAEMADEMFSLWSNAILPMFPGASLVVSA